MLGVADSAHHTSLPVLGQRGAPPARASARGVFEAPGPHPARSLYIHIPFCFHKCHYCDFYSFVDTHDRQEPFVARLERELAALAPFAGGLPLRTLFVGGGTPSLLRPDLWRRLLQRLAASFDTSAFGVGAGEFTVECNPETVTPELLDILASGGVNRLSFGAQSFEPGHLKTLERWHDPASVARAIDLARAAGFRRLSIDLIFGIPGQTVPQWRDDLRRALELRLDHLSCYNLTYEQGTAMTARLKRGEFSPADEDTEVEMFGVTLDTLGAAGLRRYEISNFARPGEESRHNLAYWRQDQWLAAGPSASGHFAGRRWKNVARIDEYLSFDDAGFGPVSEIEPPDPRRALVERVMTGLRLAEGIPLSELDAQIRACVPERAASIGRAADRLASSGLLTRSDGRLILTDAGFMLVNRVALDFARAIDPA